IIQAAAGATVSLTMTNAAGSSAEVGAIAIGGLSPAATVYRGVFQSGTGAGSVVNTLDNEGTLLVDAVASGTGVARASISDGGIAKATSGNATASVIDGISERAFAGTGGASNTITNNGSITISALANSNGTAAAANASASVEDGIFQSATATGDGNASNTLTN